jgi:PKD repeat protein
MVLPTLSNAETTNQSGSQLFTTPSDGTICPLDIKDDWKISLKHRSVFFHNSELPLAEYKKLKDEANNVKYQVQKDKLNIENPSRKLINAPILQNNFRGNSRENSIPMDNTMAVSRNGFVVSAINSNIIFAMPDGKITYTKGFADFYKILALGTRMFDPRVIYDPVQNRFIVVCLHGSDPSTSYLCIAFSKTEDPNGDWNFYKIKGDVVSDGVWFDFPNIAVSEDDLYIAGNMFTSENNYRYSMILQISKTDGYLGESLTWKYYDRVASTNGGLVFNPVPAMSSWETLTSPGIYFISNANNGYNLNYTNASVKNNPSLVAIRVLGNNNSYPPEARQKSTNTKLNTGGNRLRSAIYQNGILHFAAQSNTEKGDGGIFYGRLDIANMKVTSDVLTTEGIDYAYPTLTSFGKTEADSRIFVNYTFSGPDVFPGQAGRVVEGTDQTFDWSEEVIFKNGVSSIGSNSDESIRWGDYTGACRRFGVDRIESWAVGCYGEGRGHSTWIGQFIHDENMSDPVMEFTASLTTTTKDTLITFRDISNTTPITRKWIFQGGNPSTSTDEIPNVRYPENGVCDVTLISDFGTSIDTMTKKAFIHIQDPIAKPEAIWISDRDTIFVGDSILYTSLSSSNSLTHKWTFIGGTPMTSVEKNPTITYKKKGAYLTSLTVANTAGFNSLTKSKAVTVFEKVAPKANFNVNNTNILVNDTLVFNDVSTNAQKITWTFEGGIPETSTLKNPIVTYPNLGSYLVKLVAENAFGTDSTILENYINVGISATTDISYLKDIKLYPNPANNGLDDINISFFNEKADIYIINLYHQDGRLIKTLYQDKIKSGQNVLTFSAAMLNLGSYYISLSHNNKVLKTLPLLIVQ